MGATACPHCKKRTSAKSLKCAHCGRATRAPSTRADHQSITCPRCGSAADTATLGGVELDLCRSCRGLWFDRAELRSFGEASSDATLNAQLLELLRELGQRASVAPEIAYLPCPVCGRRMSNSNHAVVSGIILQKCAEHGTWADHDAAVRFVELMGSGDEGRLLQLAAHHKEQELQRRLRDIEAVNAMQQHGISRLTRGAQIHLVLDMFDIL